MVYERVNADRTKTGVMSAAGKTLHELVAAVEEQEAARNAEEQEETKTP